MLGSYVAVNRHRGLFAFFIIMCAGIGGTLYGYDIGVISGALLFIKHSIPLTRDQIGLIVGAVLSGGLIGTLITGSLADRFGRRTMILSACLVFASGIFVILFANNFIALFSARILLGIGVGIISVAVPLYLSEIASANIRGRSMTVFQLFLTFGILLAYCIDLMFTVSGNWRGMFAVILIPAALLFFSMLLLPETPRWLLAHQKTKRATEILFQMRKPLEARQEINAIKSSLSITKSSWKTLFDRCFWLPLFVAISIASLNQLTGINVLLQYAPLVIQHAGLTSHFGTMLGTVGMGFVNFLGTVVALFFIDYVGRRRLLMIGTIGIMISYIYLAYVTHYIPAGRLQADLSLIGLFGYIVSYAIGPGVVVWLAISELLPTKVRGKAVAICLFANSLSAAILSTVFLSIVHWIGMSGTYWLFTAFTALYFLVAYFLLPETKGKTLEEIQSFYQKKLTFDTEVAVDYFSEENG